MHTYILSWNQYSTIHHHWIFLQPSIIAIYIWEQQYKYDHNNTQVITVVKIKNKISLSAFVVLQKASARIECHTQQEQRSLQTYCTSLYIIMQLSDTRPDKYWRHKSERVLIRHFLAITLNLTRKKPAVITMYVRTCTHIQLRVD